jgi:hypothetical protein
MGNSRHSYRGYGVYSYGNCCQTLCGFTAKMPAQQKVVQLPIRVSGLDFEIMLLN